MKLKITVALFLDDYWDKHSPLLLAFSGGDDSLALLYLLLEQQERLPFSLHLAHVDHGWRKESAQEASALAQLAEKLSLPFHLRTLHPDQLTGNLEDVCRKERYRFFGELVQQFQCQAVLTGHHGDDQAETVLKRLFEGAPLTLCGGVKECSYLGDLQVWRPLLNHSKEELRLWLETKKLSGFQDVTNKDPRFLRGRMRETLLPFLNQCFGKQILHSLLNFSHDVLELRDYFVERLIPYLERIERGVFGAFLDLSQEDLHLIEYKELVRMFVSIWGRLISRENVAIVGKFLQSKVANKRVSIGKEDWPVDRGIFFFPQIDGDLFIPDSTCILPSDAVVNWGSWNVTCRNVEGGVAASSWRDLWRGECWVELPVCEDKYYLEIPKLKRPLDRWWSRHHVPAFLRSWAPVVMCRGEVVHEFLTGHYFTKWKGTETDSQQRIAIHLSHWSSRSTVVGRPSG